MVFSVLKIKFNEIQYKFKEKKHEPCVAIQL